MRLTVWMDHWQMDCCGTPFDTGATVAWRLRPATDLDWLSTALPGTAAVDAVEDHHGGDTPPTTGTVLSIATLHCRHDGRIVPGSGILTPVPRAGKWTGDLGDRHFAGFLIQLDTAPAA
ncbi:DUF6578 domain-containing protein [Actinoplanes sp. N902-109]|uniref:DUF6578 domain-containing protein n=1 Tax=Actinoplanes sp. (strain N902-109) TaxID=649831 RepID=UPI000329670F|nr:DUF6578 domain-containing protein [Actinoplanes sp. N902-109]AGL18508.1 hypothetical protein L083_4998 [Actinoplanes sp. N902-109]